MDNRPSIPTPSGWHDFFPLLHINPPHVVWENQPSLLLAEIIFLLLFLGITHHAFISEGRKLDVVARQKRIALWSASLVGGACIELCTVMKRDIGNFYHSQAVIMLFGRREPLYMLIGCYGYFNYIGCAFVMETTKTFVYLVQHKRSLVVDDTDSEEGKKEKSVQEVHLIELQEEKQVYWNHIGSGDLSQSLVAGLIGSLGWSLLDTVGLKMLWWTWHNDEPLYMDRKDGVPIASSFWIFSSIAALNWVLHKWFGKPDNVFITKDQTNAQVTTTPSNFYKRKVDIVKTLWIGCLLGPVATLFFMNVPFLLLYHPLVTGLGYHASIAYALLRAVGWSGLLSAVYRSSMQADEIPQRLEEMLIMEPGWDDEGEEDEEDEETYDDDDDMRVESSEEDDHEDSSDDLFSDLLEEEEKDDDDDFWPTNKTADHTDAASSTILDAGEKGKGSDDFKDSDDIFLKEELVTSDDEDDAEEEEYDYDADVLRRQRHRQRRQLEGIDETPVWSIQSIISTKYHWSLFLYVLLTGIFSMYVLFELPSEKSVRMSYGQPYTSYEKNCSNEIEYSFFGGFKRHVYMCEMTYQESRDIYRSCTRRDDLLFGLESGDEESSKMHVDLSFITRLRRAYGVGDQMETKEETGQWIPLCGTSMTSRVRQTVAVDTLQLIFVCLLTSFCGMSKETRKLFCTGMCSEIGALLLMLIFSMSMFFVPTSEKDEREMMLYGGEGQKAVLNIIGLMKWGLSLGLLGRIVFLMAKSSTENGEGILEEEMENKFYDVRDGKLKKQ